MIKSLIPQLTPNTVFSPHLKLPFTKVNSYSSGNGESSTGDVHLRDMQELDQKEELQLGKGKSREVLSEEKCWGSRSH